MGTASTKKFIRNNAGTLTEESALTTSAGAADANRIPALNASGVLDASIVNAKATSAGAADAGKLPAFGADGRLHATMLPVGVAVEMALITASEALSSGDFINIWSSTGFKARKADATTAGKEAHGFVLASVASGAAAEVYLEGVNTAVTGLSPGAQYLQITAGAAGATPPSGSGNIVQRLGVATSATTLSFTPAEIIVLA